MAAPGGAGQKRGGSPDSDSDDPERFLLTSGPRDTIELAVEEVPADQQALSEEVDATADPPRPTTRSSRPAELIQLDQKGRAPEPQRRPGAPETPQIVEMGDENEELPPRPQLNLDTLRELEALVNIPERDLTLTEEVVVPKWKPLLEIRR